MFTNSFITDPHFPNLSLLPSNNEKFLQISNPNHYRFAPLHVTLILIIAMMIAIITISENLHFSPAATPLFHSHKLIFNIENRIGVPYLRAPPLSFDSIGCKSTPHVQLPL